MLAIVEAYRQGLLERRHWVPNIVSGITVGVVALPHAMAFAFASGAKPEQGIYTAIIAGLVVSTCGGSRLQIAGPTGAFITVILSGITATHGIEGLQIATLMAGVMVVLLGMARLGAIIRFIPAPVILGFTAGIGLIIFVGQWKDFFGLPAPAGSHFHEQLPELLMALPGLHPAITLLAAASLLVVVYASRIPGLKRIPGPLAALIFATVLQSIFAFDGVRTIDFLAPSFFNPHSAIYNPEFRMPARSMESKAPHDFCLQGPCPRAGQQRESHRLGGTDHPL